ncbi:MAG: nicotinate-nicotinamide nucleotide adenylyltransferase [Desulfovibrionaceae bacterium]
MGLSQEYLDFTLYAIYSKDMWKSEIQRKYTIGILGGTFNPVHKGHVALAKSVLKRNLVDRIDVIPVYSAAHKDNLALLPYKVRCRLVEEIFFSEQAIHVSKIESLLPIPSYTIRTLLYYEKRFVKANIFLLMGSSDFIGIPKWYHGETIMKKASAVIVPRGNVLFDTVLNTVNRYHKSINIIHNSMQGITRIITKNLKEYVYIHKREFAISSSEIRDNVKRNALGKEQYNFLKNVKI